MCPDLAQKNPNSAQQCKSLPKFAVWQARLLLGRDFLFASFLLLTFCLYVYKTVPAACIVGPANPPHLCITTDSNSDSSSSASQIEQHQVAAATGAAAASSRASPSRPQKALQQARDQLPRCQWSWAWKLFCMQPFITPPSGWLRHADSAAAVPAAAHMRQAADDFVGVSGTADSTQPQGAASSNLLSRVLGKCGGIVLLCIQAVFSFFAIGWLLTDPFHMLMPPLRLSYLLLLLVPIPLPNIAALWRKARRAAAGRAAYRATAVLQGRNQLRGISRNSTNSTQTEHAVASTTASSSNRAFAASSSSSTSSSIHSRPDDALIVWYQPSWYCDNPGIRQGVILAQRLLPPLTAAASVGYVSTRFFGLASLRYWPALGQYVYLGWTAFMLVLPAKLHLVTSVTEWLLIFSTAVRVNTLYYGIPAVSSTTLYHLLASLLFVLVLPTAGVVWIERGQKARYQQQKQQLELQALGGEGHEVESSTAGSSKLCGRSNSAAQQQSSPLYRQQEQLQDSKHHQQAEVLLQHGMDHASVSYGSTANSGIRLRHSSLIKKQQGSAQVPLQSTGATSSVNGLLHPTSAGEFEPIGGLHGGCDSSSRRHSGYAAEEASVAESAHALQVSSADGLAGHLPSSRVQHACSHLGANSAAADVNVPAPAPAGCQAHSRSSSRDSRLRRSGLPRCTHGTASSVSDVACNQGCSTNSSAVVSSSDGSLGLDSSHGSVGTQLLAEITGSLHLAATAAPAVPVTSGYGRFPSRSSSTTIAATTVAAHATAPEGRQLLPRAPSSPTANFLASLETKPPSPAVVAAEPAGSPETAVDHRSALARSSISSLLADMMPALASMIGQDAARVVLAGAATAAGPGPQPGDMPFYTSMASVLPVSMKVYTSHSQVGMLSPLLTYSLTSQLSPINSSNIPVQLHAACFAGCVQLLGMVITLAPTAVHSGKTSICRRSTDFPAVDPQGLAASLLSTVQRSMEHASIHTSATGSSASSSCLAASKDEQQRMQDQDDAAPLPAIEVAVGDAAVGHCGSELPHKHLAAPETQLIAPSLALQCYQPACLVAGKPQQQLTLHLQPAACPEAVDGSRSCRMLVLQDERVMFDQDVSLTSNSLSVVLPLTAGVCQIALLSNTTAGSTRTSSAPGSSDDCDSGATTSASTSAEQRSQNNRAVTSAAPLLVFPVLVLPEEPARELQHMWQLAASAVDCSTTSADKHFADGLAKAWQSTVAALTVDMAYVLSACKCATQPQQQPRQIPAAIAAVLVQLLQHLARCQMHSTMQLLVDTASAAFQRTNSYPSEDESAGAATSSGCIQQLEGRVGMSSKAQPASFTQLLFGFSDPKIEASFVAAAFNSTCMLDCVSAAYNTFMGTGCWFVGRNSEEATGPQSQQLADSSWSVHSLLSVAAVLLGNIAMPAAVLLLRLHVYRTLMLLSRQHGKPKHTGQGTDCGTDQQSLHPAAAVKAASSSAAAAADAGETAVALPDVMKVCARPGMIRRRLIAAWMLLVVLLNLLCASRLVLAPAMLVNIWRKSTWIIEVNWLIGLGIKGWMYQVPLAWFVPLMASEVATNVYGSIAYNLQPSYWVWVRYPAALLVTWAVAAAYNLQSRWNFCRGRNVSRA